MEATSPLLQTLLELRSRKAAEDSLYEFTKQAWIQIEGGVEFHDGWHIEAVCIHLEAVLRREIKNLIIGLPPRCMKSTIISVMMPVWSWINNPSEKFMYASNALGLSVRDSIKCRRLIQSQWFQDRWGDRFRLMDDNNTKIKFENDKTGYRYSMSVGSSVIGQGANILVLDDPNSAVGESDSVREGTNDWYDQAFSTRLNNFKTGCKIVVQQRIHELDITGYILSKDEKGEWVRLILPMYFESKNKARTIVLPSAKGKVWEDPRKVEGQLLWPSHLDDIGVQRMKDGLGSSYAIASQLQQRPSPEEGGIIQKIWFKLWKDIRPPKLLYIIQSWDTALEAHEMNCYSACTTWGVFENFEHTADTLDVYQTAAPISNIILLSLWRGRVEYPELRAMAKRLYYDYRDDGSNPEHVIKCRQPDKVLIEAKVSGISLVQDLTRAGIPAVGFNPNKYGDKIQRVRLVTPLIECGKVWLPARAPDFKQPLSYADLLRNDACTFPNGASRDLIDTMTQALLNLKQGGWISHSTDSDRSDTSVKTPAGLYY